MKKVQAGYKAQPLSAFLAAAPQAAPTIDFIKPLTPGAAKTSLEFFNVLNFVLQFCPTVPIRDRTHGALRQARRRPGQPLDADELAPEVQAAIEQGMADAWEAFDELKKRRSTPAR